MGRHELRDEDWERVGGLLPRAHGAGRPWNDHRRTLNGIFWTLRTGAPWRDLPERYGSWKSVYGRFNRWSKDGTFDAIVERLQVQLDAAGKIDRDLWCLDGSSVRATRAAAGAGKRGAPTSRRTMRSAGLVVGGAPSSTLLATAEASHSPSN